MTEQLFSNEKFQIFNKNFRFQRWFYLFIGIGTVSVILFLTYGQISDMKNDNYDFAFCLLLIVHSSMIKTFLSTTKYSSFFSVCALFSIISTAIFCRKLSSNDECKQILSLIFRHHNCYVNYNDDYFTLWLHWCTFLYPIFLIS